jgi:hypothetical protein
VGAHYDQIRILFNGLIQDFPRGLAPERFDQLAFARDPLGAHAILRSTQYLASFFSETVDDFPVVGRHKVVRQDQFVHDMNHPYAGTAQLGERYRLFQCALGRVASINGNEDFLVHPDAPLKLCCFNHAIAAKL